MGLFQAIGALSDSRYQKTRRKLERAAANKAIYDIQSQQAFREREDPREQAHLKQTAWGRGLGKSSIAEQDKERLTMMQADRRSALARALNVAHLNKKFIKQKHRHERVSMWLGILDGIISLAAGAGGGAQNPTASGPSSGGGYDWGGGGDYNYGGGGSNYV